MVASHFQAIGRTVLTGSNVRDLNADSVGQPFTPITRMYDLYEAYYANDVYDVSARLLNPGRAVALPKTIRPVHNPAKRAVDWWPGHLYPGIWTEDGLPANGRPNRIPWSTDTDEALRLAAQQMFTWGNWGSDILVYARMGAMLGDVFVEVYSDVDRQKVYPQYLHPRHVKSIEWNASGDVTMYHIEVPRIDEKGRSYRWGKRVTKDEIVTYRDDEEVSYIEGMPARIPNPWGFVPAVWVQHRNMGGQHGSPAIDGVLGKIDELNGIVSEINDYILRFTRQYIIIGSDSPEAFREAVASNNSTQRSTSRGAREYDEIESAYARASTRQTIPVFGAKGPVSVARLYENMGLAEAVPHRDRVMEEIEKDLPEIVLSRMLLEKTNMSAPGAVPLVQDVQHKLDESAGNYDAGLVKLAQMGISIAAQCIADGVWNRRGLTDQQRKFAAFSPDSWNRGELASFSITPRSVIPESSEQRIARAAALERLTTVNGLMATGELDEDEALAWRDAVREAKQFEADLSASAFNRGQLFP